jgi:hypothetical protein
MDDGLEALLSERERLKSEMAATKRQMKQSEQKAKAAARLAAQQWQLAPRLKTVVLTIFLLAQYQPAPAVKLLHHTAHKRSWPQKDDEELERMVEDLFLAADVEQLGRLVDLDDPEDSSVATEALKYLEEWRAVEFVRDANSRLGVAPSTEDILRQLEANRLQIPESLRPVSKGTAAQAKARMWAKRWRERWGGCYGKLRLRDDTPVAEMQEKDCLFAGGWVSFLGRGRMRNPAPILVPDSGTKNGSSFRPPYNNL